jgi:hypothetical protein
MSLTRFTGVILLAIICGAIFLYLIGIIIGWVPPESQTCNYNEYYDKYTCAAHDTIYVIFVRTRAFFNSISPFIEALATVVLAIFTWRLIIVGRDQHGAAVDAISESKKSADAAVDTATATILGQRPWVRLNIKEIKSFSVNDQGIGADLVVSVKNTGNSPATNCFGWAVLTVSINAPPIKDAVGTIPEYFGVGGFSLFPGDGGPMNSTAAISLAEIASVSTVSKLPKGCYYFGIVIMIFYRFDRHVGFTSKRYMLRGPNGMIDTNALPEARQLRLVPMPLGDEAR